MIPPGDRWGPFAEGLPEPERFARCRSLRALVNVLAGPAGAATARALIDLEANTEAAPAALAALNELPPLPLRRILCTFAALHTPPRERRPCR